MNRRVAGCVLALSSLGLAVPATPAYATTDYCVGTGTVTLTGGIGWAVIFPYSTVNFEVTMVCLNPGGPTISAFGTLDANCGNSVGYGTVVIPDDDAPLEFSIEIVTAGTVVTIQPHGAGGSGEAYGAGQVTPVYGDCLRSTASEFQLTVGLTWTTD